MVSGLASPAVIWMVVSEANACRTALHCGRFRLGVSALLLVGSGWGLVLLNGGLALGLHVGWGGAPPSRPARTLVGLGAQRPGPSRGRTVSRIVAKVTPTIQTKSKAPTQGRPCRPGPIPRGSRGLLR